MNIAMTTTETTTSVRDADTARGGLTASAPRRIPENMSPVRDEAPPELAKVSKEPRQYDYDCDDCDYCEGYDYADMAYDCEHCGRIGHGNYSSLGRS